MSSLALSPGIAQTFYPQRPASRETALDRVAINLCGNATRQWWARPQRFQAIVARVNDLGEPLKSLSEEGLKKEVAALRQDLRARGFNFDLVARSFALVREFSERRLGMRHFDVQLLGGWVLFNGMVAEMQTGEGKTLVATLPACAAALAGIPVHVITVNDYLAQRDAELMRPVYEACGLTVGIIIQGMGLEERQRAYGCDITYCTNKELTFDYLKDRLVLGGRHPGQIQVRLERLYGSDARLKRLSLRGLFFAIVDEVDSVLIDEARTPLIIAGSGDKTYEGEIFQQALELAQQLQEGEDFTLDHLKKSLDLTESGQMNLEELAQPLEKFWGRRILREELVRQALVALHLFHKDKEYLIRDDKVQIIDEYTGRVMEDRHWEQGLHQLIETKEGCQITQQNETLARISYQRFFRRYLHLAGMTGTATEVANELWAVYRLQVVPIPTNKPMVREAWPARVFPSAREKWKMVSERITQLHGQGRPVLVGTRSVAASEHLSRLLTEAGLPHRVLNARQDQEEAEIIAQAGQKGQITVATNMAGRGTDILLGPGVKELGGLHVIATERHDARRIDRQLFGRCGRQGDPGSYEIVASLDDDILVAFLASLAGRLARRGLKWNASPEGRLGKLLATMAQLMAERKLFHIRRDLLKFDESWEEAMAFSGCGE
jgi:preprotein translocase subunit SecA